MGVCRHLFHAVVVVVVVEVVVVDRVLSSKYVALRRSSLCFGIARFDCTFIRYVWRLGANCYVFGARFVVEICSFPACGKPWG